MEILPKHLRIGNMVIDHHGSINTIKALNVGWARFDLDDQDACAYDLLKPVVISEDWMIKFGFLKEHRQYNPSILDTITFWKSGMGFKPVGKGRFRVSFHSDETSFFISGVNVDYVHQLQNLYFALVGEELTIKGND